MLELPASLRVDVAADRLEAAGRRAYAVEREGALHARVGDEHVVLELGGASAPGDVEVWPFAARRGGDTLFAATDQPLVVFERASGGRVRLHRAVPGAPVVTLNGTRVDDEVIDDAQGRIVVHASATDGLDAEALLGGAIARARKRAAVRPRVERPVDRGDVIARGEYRLRLALAAGEAIDARARVLAALALLAINDPKAALEAIADGSPELARDPGLCVIVCGGWSAWRGTAADIAEIRRVAGAWRPGAAADEWARAAAALGPFCDDVAAGSRSDARSVLDPADAIVHLASAAGASDGVRELLTLIHGDLGLMPDATRARVRLAPRLDVGATRVDQVAVGDATFEWSAEVGAERAVVEVEQSQGPTPLTAIVEPRVPGRRLKEALIESTPAELDVSVDEGGIRPRVQLIIDRRRTVVLLFER